VFDSNAERELFQAIDRQWGQRFVVYLHLRFPNLIDGIESLPGLTDAERRYLLVAEVDYTLCSRKEGNPPILSIEFDGFTQGFSKDGRYIPTRVNADPRRTEHLDLKVRVSTQERYPFFVVSYDEKNPIGEETQLTIVDGIIGQALANIVFHHRLNRFVENDADKIESLPPGTRYDYLDDLVLFTEFNAAWEWNPIKRAVGELKFRLWERGIARGYRQEPRFEPELPGLPEGGMFDPTVLDAIVPRFEAMFQAVRVGCTVTLDTIFGEVTETAWLRNIDYAGVFPLSLSEDIAMLLACSRADRMADQHGMD
jgi:hypothetical protein